jgi:integrase
MGYPDWLGELNNKQENLRAAHGLQARRDGWYKTIQSKRRYIARPMPLADVVKILDKRVAELTGNGIERSTPLATNATTIEELAEMFIAHLWQRVQTGTPRKMARQTYNDYLHVLERFTGVVGPHEPAADANPTWFSRFMRTINRKALTSQRRDVIYLTSFFNWAGPGRHSLNFFKDPVQFGPDFRKPDEAKVMAHLRTYSTLYTADTFNAALDAVAPCRMLYAMGLLALNCAFLPEDLATVPLSAIDLKGGVVEFPRGKNGNPRKAVLMPETIEALTAWVAERPRGAKVDPALFVRGDGKSFNQRASDQPGVVQSQGNTLARYWSWITGRPLKGLRTTFATEADGAIDQRAVDLVMGHAADSVRAKFYVKQFDAERIRSVVEPVWKRVGPRGPLPSVATIGPSALARRAVEQSAPAATE